MPHVHDDVFFPGHHTPLYKAPSSESNKLNSADNNSSSSAAPPAETASRFVVLYAANNSKKQRRWFEGILVVSFNAARLIATGASSDSHPQRAAKCDISSKSIAVCKGTGLQPNPVFLRMSQGRPGHPCFEAGEEFVFNSQWIVQVETVLCAHLVPYDQPLQVAATPLPCPYTPAAAPRPQLSSVKEPRSCHGVAEAPLHNKSRGMRCRATPRSYEDILRWLHSEYPQYVLPFRQDS